MSWAASVSIFSGRSDPTWQLEAATGECLVEIWDTLAPTDKPMPESPHLGYRGACVVAPDGRRWVVRGIIVALDEDRRVDPERRLERKLLSTAPPGAIPQAVGPSAD